EVLFLAARSRGSHRPGVSREHDCGGTPLLMPAPRTPAEATQARNAALDGLRLLAVAAVMAFHFGLPGADGGFLGVDVFFVLSGFLITSLLLHESRDGRLDVIAFWTRRLRRLLPALLVLLGAVVAWGAVVAPALSRDDLRGDITATLFYVAN